MDKCIDILDCTLRDGSYLIDYSFTAEDTYIICRGLANAGFKLVEIGHGTGLGSSRVGDRKALASDKEYLDAARAALSGTDTKFGMFFIPGIGEIEDLEMASKSGMRFVRIGTDVTEVDTAKPYIERSKELDLKVALNLMKSYAVPIDKFVKLAKLVDSYGVDTITVVDSAGGMYPHDVREYVSRLRDITETEIGFHGHNNLHLAMANTLEAVKSGASVVDSTLQGMGRSAGNTQTEILIMVLEQSGYSVGVDAYKAFDLGQRVIKPMMNRDQGLDDMSIISGIAQFHSSFFEIIKKMSKKYRIDPRLLILEVSKVNRVNVTEEIAEETAKRIKKNIVSEPDRNNKAIMLEFVKSKKSNNSLVQAKMIFDQLISQSRKTGKESVFSLTLSQNGKTVFPFIRQSKSLIIANCEAKDLAELTKIADLADGRVNWILFDGSVPDVKEQSINIKLKKSRTTYYYEKRAISLSVSTHIAQNPPKGKILLFAGYNDALYLKSLLQQIGIIDVLHMNDKEKTKERILKSLMLETGAIISFDKKYTDDLNETHSELLSPEVRIYIVKPGAFNNLFWNAAMSRGLSLFRIDTRVGLASEVYLSIETKKLLEDMGTCEIEGIPVVSGGVIGPKGTVVVDSKTTPARIIGVADGLGGLLSDECEYEEKKDRLQAILIEKLYERTF